MSRFLIQVPHPPDTVACVDVVQLFLRSGSHFLTNADWGCKDGDHSAWFIAEVDNKADALAIVPPALRRGARVVGLNRFTLQELDEIMSLHDEPLPAQTGEPR
jgi:hypothetical protein